MTAGGVLTLRCEDESVRRRLSSILSPDNQGAPPGLHLKMRGAGSRLTFEVSAAAPSAVASTLLAVLRDVSLFQDIWLLSTEGGGQ